MINKVQTAIACGDDSFRSDLASLIAGQDGFDVVASVGSGRDALSATRKHDPDILLLDMQLPDMHGLEVLRQLSGPGALHPIVLVDRTDVDEVTQALLLGACGAIEKSSKSPVLWKCIRAVIAGELWFTRDVTKVLLKYVDKDTEELRPAGDLVKKLTERENDVLRAVANGMPNRDIATRLGISEYTVKHHLSRIFGKLSVSNRVELALLASKYEL